MQLSILDVMLSPEDEDLRHRLVLRTRLGRTDPCAPSGRRRRLRPIYPRIMKRVLRVRRLPRGMVVDHIDRNPLNCRRDNLRLATPMQNAANRSVSGKGSSRFKGVHLVRKTDRWKAELNLTVIPGSKGKRIRLSLGMFETEEEAARAYDAAAQEWYGEFACTNFPAPQ